MRVLKFVYSAEIRGREEGYNHVFGAENLSDARFVAAPGGERTSGPAILACERNSEPEASQLSSRGDQSYSQGVCILQGSGQQQIT